MAGTQRVTEAGESFLTNFLLASDLGSDAAQSLDGINVSGLQNGATCYVRPPVDADYRYYEFLAVAPAPPLIVAPLVGPGRWLQIPSGAGTAKFAHGVYTGTLADPQVIVVPFNPSSVQIARRATPPILGVSLAELLWATVDMAGDTYAQLGPLSLIVGPPFGPSRIVLGANSFSVSATANVSGDTYYWIAQA
jgi:hypothetical protein